MHILVSGAGVAGLALAADLGSRGHDVTVVELSGHLRVNGSPIDIRGDALAITEKMGLMDRIRAEQIHATDGAVYVDRDGNPVARIPHESFSDSADDLEIAREDLASILASAATGAGAVIRFRDSVTALADDGEGVDVTFRESRRERYDLVLGADGLHSAVRRLAFGPEQDYLRYLGHYVALFDLPEELRPEQANPLYNEPGRMAAVFAFKDKLIGCLAFRSAPLGYDYHDQAAYKRIIKDAYAGITAWQVPELVAAAEADDACYFDSISQIHLPQWHRGRIALVGDAAHCAALLSGRGTSLALTGAYYLAEELEKSPEDPTAAFARYETRQRPYVEFSQASVKDGAAALIPDSWEAIQARNAAFS
ncbi:FAD-dependent monooxygenase [Amycolatopsis jejuensis]|uniref:FAD-dependent monooxygenase n=1 Tax=Amycolatopsis jejuensis TaxID=330084 RepID=UPI000527474D|nr:FAD-dependent monooxygenase [Amycolatopsis jejuensis]